MRPVSSFGHIGMRLIPAGIAYRLFGLLRQRIANTLQSDLPLFLDEGIDQPVIDSILGKREPKLNRVDSDRESL